MKPIIEALEDLEKEIMLSQVSCSDSEHDDKTIKGKKYYHNKYLFWERTLTKIRKCRESIKTDYETLESLSHRDSYDV